MTASKVDPTVIGQLMWKSAASADSIEPAWVEKIFHHATLGRTDLALKAATTSPTTKPKEK